MQKGRTRPLLAAALLLLSGCAGVGSVSDRVFLVGDTAYIEGHAVPREQYEAAVANGTLEQLAQQLSGRQQASQVATAGGATAAPAAGVAATSAGVRSAVCDTPRAYDTYPGDSARFSCNAGLGELSRAQLLAQGWKVDMMEKNPVAGKTSPRGLPLYTYKLILSR